MNNLTSQLREFIEAAFSGLWIETHEPDEAEREIHELCTKQGWGFARWDIAAGATWQGCQSPMAELADPLKVLTEVPNRTNGIDTLVLVLHNFHRFLNNPVVVQKLANTLREGKQHRWFFVVLAPVVQMPAELEKLFVVLGHPLPDRDQLRAIAAELDEEHPLPPLADDALDAAAGLTRYEAEGAFSLSIIRHEAIRPDVLWELKAQALQKANLLSLHRGTENFQDLGGLDSLKSFCRRALTSGRHVSAKGVLLLGVPGTGKSAFAKALGNEVNRPTLLFDLGTLYGSLVGETESKARQALQIADAMAPCILFVDEIEKALAGIGGQGDSGVSTRLFGTLLTWLNDHASDVFFVGTCNDVSKLPPEFARAERFDGVFFLDLPARTEKDAIWSLYRSHYGIEDTWQGQDDQWTGAEIKACCRLAKLLDVPLQEAARHIVPVAVTAADKVTALREWASGRCLSAAAPGIFQTTRPSPAVNGRRRTLNGKE